MLKYRIARPSQIRFYEDGTFRRVSDVVREQKALCGINLGFYSGTAAHPKGSVACGQLVIAGKNVRYPADMDPEGKGTKDAHYHALYKINGQFFISQWIPESEPGKVVEWGLKMGPRLVKGGQVCLESINDSRWDISRKMCPRVAVGIFPDGRLVGAYDSSTTPEKFAQELLALGCVQAIGCDGDSSASYTNLETGDTFGYKQMPNMLLVMPASMPEDEPAKPAKQDRALPAVDLDIEDRHLTTNFMVHEFRCECCGALSISKGFVEGVARLQLMRYIAGVPIEVTSGYRCAKHDREVGTSAEPGFGPHTTGEAFDVTSCLGVERMAEIAKEAAFTGIGKYPNMGFVHVDMLGRSFVDERSA